MPLLSTAPDCFIALQIKNRALPKSATSLCGTCIFLIETGGSFQLVMNDQFKSLLAITGIIIVLFVVVLTLNL